MGVHPPHEGIGYDPWPFELSHSLTAYAHINGMPRQEVARAMAAW